MERHAGSASSGAGHTIVDAKGEDIKGTVVVLGSFQLYSERVLGWAEDGGAANVLITGPERQDRLPRSARARSSVE